MPHEEDQVMKTHYTVALAMLVGVAIGGVAIQGLHAQAKTPAYAVIVIRKINDAEAYKAVLAKAPAAAKAANGHFLIRTDKITSIDGTPPERYVVIAFDNIEQAQAWHNSAAQKEVDAIRVKTTDSLSFIVEGAAN
jgi:uncharacterized protein (DUF1330 family)